MEQSVDADSMSGAGVQMATANPAKAATMIPPVSCVTVRMYRQGLGDCFLLAFPTEKSRPFYMLIDCGVIKGTEKPGDKIKAVAEDIERSTGGQIDVLVSTHEHWDHVSGFLQAEEVFKRLQIDEVWLAWTENRTDDLANALRNRRAERVKALTAAVERMQGLVATADTAAAHRARESGSQVHQLLQFFGALPMALGPAREPEEPAAASGKTTGDALASIQTDGSNVPRKVRYFRPGDDPTPIPVADAVRIYVLGPPHDEKAIKRSDPSKSHPEVYELAPRLDMETAFLAAAEHGHKGEDDLTSVGTDVLERLNRSFPFDKCYHVERKDAEEMQFFQDRYGFTKPNPEELDESWRRIDEDWLGAAGQLALQLDSDTNNTSLAMAIEIGKPGKGKVLLFPGDAQVGNWLSWHQYVWLLKGGDVQITAKDLLARTVLYKVGHHASHNATLRDLGLALMTSRELVAMIPVNHDMAVKKKWNMPFPPLLEALKLKTEGRILRADDGIPTHVRLNNGPQKEIAWVADPPVAQGAVGEPGYLEITIQCTDS